MHATEKLWRTDGNEQIAERYADRGGRHCVAPFHSGVHSTR
jgi:hypothetical protein